MTFSQQLLSTFLGSMLAFAFGIVLFYLTEWAKAKREKSRLLKGLRKEFEFNTVLIDKWIEDTDKTLHKISSGDREVYQVYRLTDFQRLFTQLSFQNGILYDILRPQDLAELNVILIHFDVGTSEWCNRCLDDWRSGKLQAAEANRVFDYEKDKLKEFKAKLNEITRQFPK